MFLSFEGSEDADNLEMDNEAFGLWKCHST